MKTTIIIILILFSIIAQSFLFNDSAIAQSSEIQALSNQGNWEFINYNNKATNHIPQNDINKENVHLLELKWAYPFPAASNFREMQSVIPLTEGAMTPPLIVNGVIYATSNMRNTYALDSSTGKLIWTNIWEFDWEDAYRKLPLTGGLVHVHGTNYIDGKLFPSTVACSILAIDAISGQTKFEMKNLCRNIDGNNYNWPSYKGQGLCGLSSHPGIIYQPTNIYITSICGADSNWGGRAFIDAYDLDFDPPKRLWRKFLAPPAEGDPEWALHECDKGWFFSYKQWKEEGKLGIPCTDVPRENIMNDWGVPKHYNSAVSLLWGQMAIDEETGIVYFGTGNQGGWINNTYTQGPNLFASSIIALNVTNGNIEWWYQTVVRDMVQGDAAWNTVLAKLTIDGEEKKVILKYSVTGLLWALDAATGEPLWIFESPLLESRTDPDGAIRGRTSGHPCIGCDPNTQDGYWNNVMSYYDMQEKKWLNYPSKDWFYIIPLRAGEADIAFNTERNTIFLPLSLGWDASAKPGNHKSIGMPPGEYNLNYPKQTQNTTIIALDAITGKVKWSYFIDGVAYRGGIISSGDLVFVPAADGYLYIIDGLSGEYLHKIFLNTPLVVQPTIGQTSNGDTYLYIINGGKGRKEIGGLEHNQVPGSLMAFGLPNQESDLPKENDIGKNKIIGNNVDKDINEDEIENTTNNIRLILIIGLIVLFIYFFIYNKKHS